MGYVNEKAGSGSIIPNWIIHSMTNFVAAGMISIGGL